MTEREGTSSTACSVRGTETLLRAERLEVCHEFPARSSLSHPSARRRNGRKEPAARKLSESASTVQGRRERYPRHGIAMSIRPISMPA